MKYVVVGYCNGYAGWTVAVQGLEGVQSVMKDLQSRGCTEFKVRVQ